jgi:hypothetical protein
LEDIHPGGCSCGVVRFEARGRPKFVSNCHCGDCRKATGAPFSTWVGYDAENVTWHGERAFHESSPCVKRGYCGACGTPLSYSGPQWAGETHLLVGTFDAAELFTPTSDVFVTERLPWVRLIGE